MYANHLSQFLWDLPFNVCICWPFFPCSRNLCTPESFLTGSLWPRRRRGASHPPCWKPQQSLSAELFYFLYFLHGQQVLKSKCQTKLTFFLCLQLSAVISGLYLRSKLPYSCGISVVVDAFPMDKPPSGLSVSELGFLLTLQWLRGFRRFAQK